MERSPASGPSRPGLTAGVPSSTSTSGSKPDEWQILVIFFTKTFAQRGSSTPRHKEKKTLAQGIFVYSHDAAVIMGS